MAPPIYQLSLTIVTKVEVPTRVSNVKRNGESPWYEFNRAKGYRKVSLPVGRYETREIWRDLRYYHDVEHSDGYTYRLRALDKDNILYGSRISVWQDDLRDAIEGVEEGGEE